MKPLFSALLVYPSRNGKKTAWIPLPLPEDDDIILPLSDRLNITGENLVEKDEILGYRSQLGITPNASISPHDVEYVAEYLSKFTTEQLECLKKMIRVFNMKFDDIYYFTYFLDVFVNAKKEIKTNFEMNEGEK